MYKNSPISLFFLVFISLMIISCSKNADENIVPDDRDSINTYGVDYIIGIQNSMDPYATEEELMKTLLLVIVDSSGQIEEIIDIELPQMVEQHTVETNLTLGEKDVYGFANFTSDMRIQTGLDNLTVGQTMPDLTNTVMDLPNGYQVDSSQEKWLPMSNRVKYIVTKLSAQRFSMALIRLVSKVAFNFRNETGYNITLKEVRMSPLTSSPVYLLPSGNDFPVLPSGTTQEEYTYTFDSSYVFDDQEELSCMFYVNESVVNGGDWFQLRLVSQREQETGVEERMAVTQLSSLNRNDYLPLSVILTDYKLELNIRSYPPIGGYPASVTEEADGYHCCFIGGGPFVIIPSLRRLSDNLVIEIDDDDWTLTYTDVSPTLFDKSPVMENGEITGSLELGTSGTALFTVSAEVITSGNISRILSYKVYISQ